MHVKYSVVVPLKNEEENIEELVKEIRHTMHSLGDNWELICVDDGSSDGTLPMLKRLSHDHPFLRVMSFDRNYGQSSAFDAGFRHARGEWVITLDGDRQNDPTDIPRLLAVAGQYDLVCGSRVNRQDSWQKKMISRLANFVRSRLCHDQISDTGCSLKVYRSSCLREIKMFKGMHRFLPALFKIEGFRVAEMPVNHRERLKGTTKYNFFNRSFNTIADMLAVRWMWKRRIHYRIKEGGTSKTGIASRYALFFCCGERSGDLHGSALVKALRERCEGLSLSGIAGPKMRAQGVVPLMQMEKFEVMGLSDVLASLPKLVRAFYKIRNRILKDRPDAVILIDNPGFNLRLAHALRKKGYRGKLVQYVSPSVWAWGKERIETMSRTLDLLLTVYPFEARFFAYHTLNVRYVGHPLLEYVKQHRYAENWQQQLNIPKTDHLIALFPGSRPAEIKRNLPPMLDAIALYKQKYPEALFALSAMHAAVGAIVAGHALSPELKASLFFVPPEYNYELMRDSCSAIAKSGSVTLELALHCRPTVVIYQLSFLNRLYAQFILRLKLSHYCIVNIMAGQELFPELIKEQLTVQKLFLQLERVDRDLQVRTQTIQGCQRLMEELGQAHASGEAADQLLRILK